MKNLGVFEPSYTKWAIPVVLIPKYDVSIRLCVHCRLFSFLTVRDSYSIPRMASALIPSVTPRCSPDRIVAVGTDKYRSMELIRIRPVSPDEGNRE